MICVDPSPKCIFCKVAVLKSFSTGNAFFPFFACHVARGAIEGPMDRWDETRVNRSYGFFQKSAMGLQIHDHQRLDIDCGSTIICDDLFSDPHPFTALPRPRTRSSSLLSYSKSYHKEKWMGAKEIFKNAVWLPSQPMGTFFAAGLRNKNRSPNLFAVEPSMSNIHLSIGIIILLLGWKDNNVNKNSTCSNNKEKNSSDNYVSWSEI